MISDINTHYHLTRYNTFVLLKQYIVYGTKVIQNRHNGSVEFGKTWLEYSSGFGFVLTEYWIGKHEGVVASHCFDIYFHYFLNTF